MLELLMRNPRSLIPSERFLRISGVRQRRRRSTWSRRTFRICEKTGGAARQYPNQGDPQCRYSLLREKA